MQNGHTEPEKLLERVRSEVQRRKLGLAATAPSPPPAPSIAAPMVEQPMSAAKALAPPAPSRSENKPGTRKARGALERAATKNASADRWPRFLRSLRRNQEAINASFIRAIGATLESLRLCDPCPDEVIVIDADPEGSSESVALSLVCPEVDRLLVRGRVLQQRDGFGQRRLLIHEHVRRLDSSHFGPRCHRLYIALALRHVDQYFSGCAILYGLMRRCGVCQREPVQRQAGVFTHRQRVI